VLDNVKESIQHSIRERFSSPILGSFTFFLVIFHWRTVVLIFSHEAKGEALITELERFWPHSFKSYILPIIFALLYSFTYPYLRMFYALFLQRVRLLQIKNELASELAIAEAQNKIEERKLVIENSTRELKQYLKIVESRLDADLAGGKVSSDVVQRFEQKFGKMLKHDYEVL